MVNHTTAPLQRPKTRFQRGRSRIDPNELDLAARLSTVTPPVGPSHSNINPNPDPGMSSHPMEPEGLSQGTVR